MLLIPIWKPLLVHQHAKHTGSLFKATRREEGATPNAAPNHAPSRGEAGHPRAPRARRRPNMATPRVFTTNTSKPKNNHRGLRSLEATANRKENRSTKRKWARRTHRRDNKSSLPLEAPAQEPQPPPSRIPLRRKLRIATLNIRRIKQAGKRKEIEEYMWKHTIDILFI